MPLTYNNISPAAIDYNSNALAEVTYNGATVWQAAPVSRASEFFLPYETWMGTITLYLTQSAANAVTVDWGDGTAAANPSELNVVLSHTYFGDLDYVIRVTCASGETWSPGDTISGTPYPFTGASPYLVRGSLGTGATFTNSAPATFESSDALKSFDFGDTITLVPVRAFRYCTALESVDLPPTVTLISPLSFSGCSGLTSFTCRATTPPTLGSQALTSVPATCPIYVPANSVAAYQAASQWKARAAYIQAIP